MFKMNALPPISLAAFVLGLACPGASMAAEAQPLTAPLAASGPLLPDPGPLPMALADLDSVSAGEGIEVNVVTDQDLTATTSGNTINAGAVESGGISFSPGALTGFSGVGNFVNNTGNNSTLQGNISVTVINTSDLH